jgi:hypothetical protein
MAICSLICYGGALLWQSVIRQKELERAFNSHGLILLFDQQNQPETVMAAGTFSTSLCSAKEFAALISNLPIKHIYLANTSIDSKYIKALHLSRVKSINLNNTNITNDVIDTILSWNEIEYVHLNNTRVTDEGVMRLGALKRLKQLSLRNIKLEKDTIMRLRVLLPDTDIKL